MFGLESEIVFQAVPLMKVPISENETVGHCKHWGSIGRGGQAPLLGDWHSRSGL